MLLLMLVIEEGAFLLLTLVIVFAAFMLFYGALTLVVLSNGLSTKELVPEKKMNMQPKNYRNLILLLGLTLLGTRMFAQSLNNYTFSATSGVYSALPADAIRISSIETDDASSGAIPIGFPFLYMGKVYTQLYATSNGVLAFGGVPVATENNKNVTDRALTNLGAAYRPIIAPLWHDLGGGGSEAYYKTTGSTGSRIFSIEFRNWKWRFYSGNSLSMMVKLYEATGVIEMYYRQEASAPINPGGSIGITGEITGSGNFISLQNTSASPTVSSTTEVSTLATRPATGQVYRFTPPATSVNAPSSILFSSITQTSLTLGWTDLSTNETNFNVLISTDNVNFSRVGNGAVVSTTGATTGTNYSLNVAGLFAGTTYYFRVIANTEGIPSTALTGNVSTLPGITYTWNQPSGTHSFTTATNWTPSRNTPDPSDILVFNNGANLVLTGFTSQTIGQVSVAGNTSVDLRSSAAATLTVRGADGTDLNIAKDSRFLLGSTGTASIAIRFASNFSDATAMLSGTLQVSSNTSGNNTLDCQNAVVTVRATGKFACYGTVSNSSSTRLILQDSGTYEHGTNNDFPAIGWGNKPGIIVTGITGRTTLSFPAQMHSLVWNCPFQSSAITMYSWSVTSMLRMISSGTTGSLIIGSGYFANTDTLQVDGGVLSISSSTSTMDLNGQILINGGTLSALGGSTSTTINVNNKKFRQTGGTITTDRPNGLIFNLRDSLIQTGGSIIATSPGTIQINFVAYDNKVQQVSMSGTVTGVVNYLVSNGNESVGVYRGINLSGSLPVNNNAELRISVNGTPVKGAGTVSYAANSNLILQATAGPQTISDALWGTVTSPGNLVINNNSSAYLTSSKWMNGTITLTSGVLNLCGYMLTLSETASIVGTLSSSRMIVLGGSSLLRKVFPAGSNLSFTYPVGDTIGSIEYSPIRLDLVSNSAQRSIGIRLTDGNHPQIAGSTNYLSRYWSLESPTLSGGTYQYILSATYLSADVTGTETSIRPSLRYNGRWLQSNASRASGFSIVSPLYDQSTNINGVDFTGRTQPPYVWTGAISDQWAVSGNWNITGFPDNETADDVILTSNVANQPVIPTGTYRIKSLLINHPSASLRIKGDGILEVADTVLLQSGTIALGNTGILTVAGTSNYKGIMVIAEDARVRCFGDVNVSKDLQQTGNATIELLSNNTQRFKGHYGKLILSDGIKTVDSAALIYDNLIIADARVTLNTNNRLTLVSTASKTAMLDEVPTGAAIMGDMKIERYIPAGSRASRALCSPISGFTFMQLKDDIYLTGPGGILNGFDNSSGNATSIYTHAETTPSRGWIGCTNANNVLAVGQGGLVFIRGDRSVPAPLWYTAPFPPQNAVTIDFDGPVNYGDINLPLSYTSTGNILEDGWNLIGNPYPAPIDWNDPLLGKTNVSNIIYVLNPSSTSYEVYNGNNGLFTGAVNNIIPSGIGFFVQAIGSGASLTLKEGAKVASAPFSLFKTGTTAPFLRIKLLRDSTKSDETLVAFTSTGSPAYQIHDDAVKMMNSFVNVFTHSSDGIPLQINSYGNLGNIDSIWLSLETVYTGTHTIKWSNPTTLPTGKHVMLIDVFTNSIVNMRTDTQYTFQVTNNSLSKGGQRLCIVIANVQALPLRWLSISAQTKNLDALIEWKTVEERNVSHFELEFSVNGVDFDRLGVIKTSGVNGGAVSTYRFTHQNALINNKKTAIYYRVKQLDLGGEYSYSPVVTLIINEALEEEMSCTPNPFIGEVNLKTGNAEDITSVTLTDMFGNTVPVKLIIHPGYYQVIIDENINSGVYILSATKQDGKVYHTKLIKE